MEKIILDTSALVKLFSPDEKDDTADRLLAQFVQKKLALITLDIALYELTNTLKLSKRASSETIITNISDVLETQERIITFSGRLIRKGLSLMEAFNLTIYDSVFIAAAEEENIPLLTADYKHHAKKLSRKIIWYDEWR